MVNGRGLSKRGRLNDAKCVIGPWELMADLTKCTSLTVYVLPLLSFGRIQTFSSYIFRVFTLGLLYRHFSLGSLLADILRAKYKCNNKIQNGENVISGTVITSSEHEHWRKKKIQILERTLNPQILWYIYYFGK